jgi:arylsulfatase A-like enzyme
LLKELGIYENTLIFFCSDNGYGPEGTITKQEQARGIPTLDQFFAHRGPFRGAKGDVHEGGLRVPMIAHWPARIRRARVSDVAWAFWDFLPTAAELAEVPVPCRTDGVSIVPTLRGREDKQPQREFFYWEFFGSEGLEQAVRIGNHRVFRAQTSAPIEVYDVVGDIREQQDLAAARPDLVARAEALFRSEHTPSLYNPTLGETVEDWEARVKAAGVRLPQNVDLF